MTLERWLMTGQTLPPESPILPMLPDASASLHIFDLQQTGPSEQQPGVVNPPAMDAFEPDSPTDVSLVQGQDAQVPLQQMPLTSQTVADMQEMSALDPADAGLQAGYPQKQAHQADVSAEVHSMSCNIWGHSRSMEVKTTMPSDFTSVVCSPVLQLVVSQSIEGSISHVSRASCL